MVRHATFVEVLWFAHCPDLAHTYHAAGGPARTSAFFSPGWASLMESCAPTRPRARDRDLVRAVARDRDLVRAVAREMMEVEPWPSGDVVEVEISGVGTLTNPVVGAPSAG